MCLILLKLALAATAWSWTSHALSAAGSKSNRDLFSNPFEKNWKVPHKFIVNRLYETNRGFGVPYDQYPLIREVEPRHLTCSQCGKEIPCDTKAGEPSSKEAPISFTLEGWNDTYFIPKNVSDLEGSCGVLVTFNVGTSDKDFSIARSALERNAPRSILTKKVNEKWSKSPFSSIHLNDNAKYFQLILDFVKFGRVSLPPDIFKASFMKELASYEIPYDDHLIQYIVDPSLMTKTAMINKDRMDAFQEHIIDETLMRSIKEFRDKLDAAEDALAIAEQVFSNQTLVVDYEWYNYEVKSLEYLNQYLKYFGLQTDRICKNPDNKRTYGKDPYFVYLKITQVAEE